MSRYYPPQLKEEVIRYALKTDEAVCHIARRFGVNEKTLYNWLTQTRGATQRKAPKDEGLQAENKRLKKELKRVEEERDILKKWLGYRGLHE